MNPEEKLLTKEIVGACLKSLREARGLTEAEAARQLSTLLIDWNGPESIPFTEKEWCDLESGATDLFSDTTIYINVTDRLFDIELTAFGGFNVLSFNANRALVGLLDGLPKTQLAKTLSVATDDVNRYIKDIARIAKAPIDPRQWPAVRSALLNNLELADQCAAEVAAVQAKYSTQMTELDPDKLATLRKNRSAARKQEELDSGPGR
jgi:hypothetical protein